MGAELGRVARYGQNGRNLDVERRAPKRDGSRGWELGFLCKIVNDRYRRYFDNNFDQETEFGNSERGIGYMF